MAKGASSATGGTRAIASGGANGAPPAKALASGASCRGRACAELATSNSIGAGTPIGAAKSGMAIPGTGATGRMAGVTGASTAPGPAGAEAGGAACGAPPATEPPSGTTRRGGSERRDGRVYIHRSRRSRVDAGQNRDRRNDKAGHRGQGSPDVEAHPLGIELFVERKTLLRGRTGCLGLDDARLDGCHRGLKRERDLRHCRHPRKQWGSASRGGSMPGSGCMLSIERSLHGGSGNLEQTHDVRQHDGRLDGASAPEVLEARDLVEARALATGVASGHVLARGRYRARRVDDLQLGDSSGVELLANSGRTSSHERLESIDGRLGLRSGLVDLVHPGEQERLGVRASSVEVGPVAPAAPVLALERCLAVALPIGNHLVVEHCLRVDGRGDSHGIVGQDL